jgi:lipopolysaccharide biosynthesis glycosyltransferase
MKNLIYFCAFFNEGYIELSKLLMSSIIHFGNINSDTTDILMMTSQEFRLKVEKDELFEKLNVKFHIVEANSLYEACYSRLRIFEYDKINDYDKILYIDTDVLFLSDINEVFNNQIDEKIYAVEEAGSRKWHYFLYSKYEALCVLPKKSFSTGIMLFKNSIIIKDLFNKILNHIIEWISLGKKMPSSVDQPFVIYHALENNLYDNELLTKYVSMWMNIELDEYVYNDKYYKDKKLVHFVGTGTGGYKIKLDYLTKLFEHLVEKRRMRKIYIISDEILIDNQKWICDRLKEQFAEYFPLNTTNQPEEADYIWYIAPWNYQYIPDGYYNLDWLALLKRKKIVMTIHHIDADNLATGKYTRQFKFIKKYASKIHSICPQTTRDIYNFGEFMVPIITKYLWEKDPQFYQIGGEEKIGLRKKYGIEESSFVIGNFQNDKKSKAPEIFLKIVLDMIEKGQKIEVVLCGRNRQFLIDNFENFGVKYHYHQMAPLEIINELYNCLNLYIITSRYEGGPRSIIECALTKTPVISTKVGIAPEFMDANSLFDVNDWTSYRDSIPNPDILANNIAFLRKKDYMEEFRAALFP